MKILSYSDPGYVPFVRRLNRRAMPEPATRDLVAQIIHEVGSKGDEALFVLTKRFDNATLTARTLFVSDAEYAAAEAAVTPETKEAVKRSLKNIGFFAKKSLRKDWSTKNAEGAEVGRERSSMRTTGSPCSTTAITKKGLDFAASLWRLLSIPGLPIQSVTGFWTRPCGSGKRFGKNPLQRRW